MVVFVEKWRLDCCKILGFIGFLKLVIYLFVFIIIYILDWFFWIKDKELENGYVIFD